MIAAVRDSQKSRVYASEQQLRSMYDVSGGGPVDVFGVPLVLETEDRFVGLPAVQAYVDRVTSMPAVMARFGPTERVTVRHRKGDALAHYCAGEIAVHIAEGSWGLREIVILHELAHHYAGHVGRDSHGGAFTNTFLELIGLVIGPQTQLALRIMYDHNGVEVR